MIDLLRDPRETTAHEELAELLRLPPWQFALGRLDQDLLQLQAAGTAAARPPEERMAFRVEAIGEGGFNIEPVIQKRARNGGYSKGSRFHWHNLAARPGLTEADERVYQAYSNRRAARRHAVGRLADAGAGVRHPARADRSPGRVPGRPARGQRAPGHPPGAAAAAVRHRRRRQPGAAASTCWGSTCWRPRSPRPCATGVTWCTCTGPRAAARRCCWPSCRPAGGGADRAALAAAPASFPARGPRRPGRAAGEPAGGDGHRVPLALDPHHRPRPGAAGGAAGAAGVGRVAGAPGGAAGEARDRCSPRARGRR